MHHGIRLFVRYLQLRFLRAQAFWCSCRVLQLCAGVTATAVTATPITSSSTTTTGAICILFQPNHKWSDRYMLIYADHCDLHAVHRPNGSGIRWLQKRRFLHPCVESYKSIRLRPDRILPITRRLFKLWTQVLFQLYNINHKKHMECRSLGEWERQWQSRRRRVPLPRLVTVQGRLESAASDFGI